MDEAGFMQQGHVSPPSSLQTDVSGKWPPTMPVDTCQTEEGPCGEYGQANEQEKLAIHESGLPHQGDFPGPVSPPDDGHIPR